MLAITFALRLIGFTAGACLHVFLIVLLLRKPNASLVDRLMLAALFASGLWHTASAINLFYRIGVEKEHAVLVSLATGGMVLAPSFLLHAAVRWAGLANGLAVPGYVIGPAVWWALETGRPELYQLWLGVSMAWVAGLCVYAARGRGEAHERRFFQLFAGAALAILLAGALAGPGSAAMVLASLAPPLVFALFVYRYHLFGLLIGRRVVFALTLGVAFAFYLFLVRRLADFAQDEFEVFGPLVEVALIFAAALVWLPLYGWMTRFLSKRTQLYADFSKRLIEEAARILDLDKRLQFLSGEVGRTFGLRRAMLITAGEPQQRGEFGAQAFNGDLGVFGKIEERVRARKTDVAHRERTADAELRTLLGELGFTYLFPLWYEDHLTGLLFLDTSPQLFLDENEPILLGLSRQISHSIETCRVIEEKLGLEKALVRQEHLASLGKVAAAIAHEIKNPLSSVKTLAQLMREDSGVTQKYDRDLNYMIGEVDRLNRSVQQLLNFSRPAAELQQEVNVTELLETMAELLARQYADEQIRIEHQVEPRLILKRSNPELIKQIVLNLALNAIQASQAGGTVRVEAASVDDGIAISVSDQGSGIPAEVREKIFEPFYTTKQRGTGLGLAIVRKNVRHLSGEIAIESPILEGKGTRVLVTLPPE